MAMLRNWRRYFFHNSRKPARVPRQFVADYDMLPATRDERLLMEANLARSPLEARRVMAKYGCSRAVDVLKACPATRRGASLRERFELLVMRWQGATDRQQRPRWEPSCVRVKYRYRA